MFKVNPILAIVLCAKYEEARHIREVFSRANLQIQELTQNGTLCHKTTMSDCEQRPINIEIYSIEKMGSVASATVAMKLIMERDPCLMFMGGICAGNPNKAKLGDIIVAEKVVDITSGKVGTTGYAHDVETYSINSNLNNYIESVKEKLYRNSSRWQKLLSIPRPFTQRYKKEYILAMLYKRRKEAKSSAHTRWSLTAMLLMLIVSCTSGWVICWLIFVILSWISGCLFGKSLNVSYSAKVHRLIIQKQLSGYADYDECLKLLNMLSADKNPPITHDKRTDTYYTSRDQYDRVCDATSIDGVLKTDPTTPEIIRGVLGTNPSAVVASMSDKDWCDLSEKLAQRNLVGLEMEGHGLYNATNTFNDCNDQKRSIVKTIVVKGVSDLASSEKDDQFHDYAKQISAVFIHEFLYHYGSDVCRDRFTTPQDNVSTFSRTSTPTSQEFRVKRRNTSQSEGDWDEYKEDRERCYRCNKMGHLAARCNLNLTIHNDKCYRCGHSGHWAEECYAKKDIDGKHIKDQKYY